MKGKHERIKNFLETAEKPEAGDKREAGVLVLL